jgi:hypothetical protein
MMGQRSHARVEGSNQACNNHQVHQGESLCEKPAKNPISYVGRIPQTLQKLTKRNADFNATGSDLTRRLPNQSFKII